MSTGFLLLLGNQLVDCANPHLGGNIMLHWQQVGIENQHCIVGIAHISCCRWRPKPTPPPCGDFRAHGFRSSIQERDLASWWKANSMWMNVESHKMESDPWGISHIPQNLRGILFFCPLITKPRRNFSYQWVSLCRKFILQVKWPSVQTLQNWKLEWSFLSVPIPLTFPNPTTKYQDFSRN